MKELAALYFPNSASRSATTQLRRWITYNKALSQALDETGYTRGSVISRRAKWGLCLSI